MTLDTLGVEMKSNAFLPTNSCFVSYGTVPIPGIVLRLKVEYRRLSVNSNGRPAQCKEVFKNDIVLLLDIDETITTSTWQAGVFFTAYFLFKDPSNNYRVGRSQFYSLDFYDWWEVIA